MAKWLDATSWVVFCHRYVVLDSLWTPPLHINVLSLNLTETVKVAIFQIFVTPSDG